MDILQSVTTSVDEDFKNFTPLNSLCGQLNIKPSIIVLPIITVTLLISLFAPSLGSKMITFFTVVYPCFMTFEAIHKKSVPNCKKWMVFWLIFCFFLAFDSLVKVLLFFLPGYYAFKFLFLLWLFYPRTDGATVMHEKIFKPYSAQIKQRAKMLAQQLK